MKLANITLARDDHATATILAKQYIETVPFWKITWAPQHVIFHTNISDENCMIVYRGDRIFEITTEELEN
jgi:hypothetical protein